MSEKPEKKSKMGRPRVRTGSTYGGRSGKTILARVDEQTKEGLERYLQEFNKNHPRTTIGAIVELAVKEFLERNKIESPSQ